MSIPFFSNLSGSRAHRSDELSAIAAVYDRGDFILGQEVDRFESEFAKYCGARSCIGVANGLDALTIALRAAGIQPGQEVIVPSNTFIATWLAVAQIGGKLIPVDVELGSGNLTGERVEAAITERTAAVIVVHLYGRPVDMRDLSRVCKKHGIFLLEDAAQAHGAEVFHSRTGSLSDAAAFSFYPTKNLGGVGDGGAITTSNVDIENRSRRFRNYGSQVKYQHLELGVNSRLDEIQAALLRIRLTRLDAQNARRRQIAERYTAGLTSVSGCLSLPLADAEFTKQVWHLYTIRTKDRDSLQRFLLSRGVGTLVHYPTPPHLQPAFPDFAHLHLPNAVEIAATTLSLPMFPGLSDEDVDTVVEAIKSFVKAQPARAN